MIKIYHNPRCKKSREGLEFLKRHSHDIEIIDYISHPLSEKQISDLILKMGIKPFELVRTQEEEYKTQYRGKSFTDNEWVKILAGSPRLMQRPVVETNKGAVLAQPAEKILTLLK